jgi:hypothetical protein
MVVASHILATGQQEDVVEWVQAVAPEHAQHDPEVAEAEHVVPESPLLLNS